MSDQDSDDAQPLPGEEPMLRAALRTPPLGPASLERVRAAVHLEWRAALGRDVAADGPAAFYRLRRFSAAVAAALAVAGVAFWIAQPHGPSPAVGSVARAGDGALSAVARGESRRVAEGAMLRIGDRITAQGPALVALARGGTLRISAGSDLSVVSDSRFSLARGMIYLDLPAGAGGGTPLRILTQAGTVEHAGTEFEVKSDAQAVRVRVREGRVRFIGATNTVVAGAGTELLAAPGKPIEQRPVETYGRDWFWTASLAPDYDIEGRSLIGFLQWVSRELGRPLNFADANARQVADRTILHGSVRHQAPMDAMSNVLATTSLSYEIRGDAIWVRSGGPASL